VTATVLAVLVQWFAGVVILVFLFFGYVAMRDLWRSIRQAIRDHENRREEQFRERIRAETRDRMRSWVGHSSQMGTKAR